MKTITLGLVLVQHLLFFLSLHLLLSGVTAQEVGYITDITFVAGDDRGAACPEGYTKDWTDLNSKAGGKFIFLCYMKQDGKTPVTDIKFVTAGKSLYADACPGYQFVEQDLNEGAGGHYVHACIKKGSGEPLTELKIVTGKEAYKTQCNGFVTRDTDLNQGAGGEFVYMCFKQAVGAIDKVRVFDVKYDLSRLNEASANIKEVNQIIIDNNDKSSSEAQTLKGKVEVTTEKSWELSNEIGIGMTVEIVMGDEWFFGLKSTWKVDMQYKFTVTNGGSISETEAQEYNFACSAAPYTQTSCEAVYKTTKLSVPYTAKAEYVYMDGSTKTKSISGTFHGTSASSIMMNKRVLKNYAYKLPFNQNEELEKSARGKMLLKIVDDYRKLRDTIQCKDEFYENRCYMTVRRRMNMYDALSMCEGWGGKLTSISSANENEFVKNQCKGATAWIGGFRTASNNFVWMDESSMKYVNWAPQKPTKEQAKVRLEAMQMTSSGQWTDADALSTDTANCFVCKK